MFERKVLIDVFAGAVRCVSLCVSLLLVATSTLLFATSSLGGSNCYADGPLKTAAATAKNAMQIPRHVLRLAHARGLADADIKPMGDNWVACSKANDGTDSCTVLCRIESSPVAHIPSMESVISDVRVGDSIVVQEYGQPARTIAFTSEMASRSRDVEVDGVGTLRLVSAGQYNFQMSPALEARASVAGRISSQIDQLPRFRRETTNIVRTHDFRFVQNYIDAHADEPFIVIVTVPALCEPCRQMDTWLTHAKDPSTKGIPVKTFILEYFAFHEAEQEVLGPGAIFPTTLIYPSASRSGNQPRQSIARAIGNLKGSTLKDVSQPLQSKLKRGAPHTLIRGATSRETLELMVSDAISN